MGFVVLLVGCGQLPLTVSLRGGICRRGNLPVQAHRDRSTQNRSMHQNVPYFEALWASNGIPGDCHGPFGPRNDMVVGTGCADFNRMIN